MHNPLHVLIVAEHASAKFGGEAILPLHYFKQLNAQGVPTWLVVHERTRAELVATLPALGEKIAFVSDTRMHIALWKLGHYLPKRIATFTTGMISRIYSQILQRKLIKRIILENSIDIIHQPMPVSPKDPSLIFGFGIPVVIGPMNGGMNFPPAFNYMQGRVESLFVATGRALANFLNLLIPGKMLADRILVANDRTLHALPACVSKKRVQLFPENGVDLELWQPSLENKPCSSTQNIKFIFMGRLVALKGIDILLEAFRDATQNISAELIIIGDGEERADLERRAERIFPPSTDERQNTVKFTGWITQQECSVYLHSADVMVFPSLMECGGAVVLEAMAMGKPVIATHWGGPADYLDEQCGVLIQPTSRAAMVDNFSHAMIRLARDPNLRTSLGENGRQKIENLYNWSVKARDMIHVYQSVIAQRKHA